MELPLEVTLFVSLLATVLTWGLKLVFVSKGKEVPAIFYSVVVGIISLGIALFFTPLQLPPPPLPSGNILLDLAAALAYLASVLPTFSALVGFATLIYNALKDKILDGLGEAVLRRLSHGSDVG